MNCPKCGAQMRKNGTYKTAAGIGQQWICKSCRKTSYIPCDVKENDQPIMCNTPKGLTKVEMYACDEKQVEVKQMGFKK